MIKDYQICGDKQATRERAIDSLYKRVNKLFSVKAAFTVSKIEERLIGDQATFVAYGQLSCESLNPYELRGKTSKTKEAALSSLEKLIKETADNANTKLTPTEIVIEENPHKRTFSAYARCTAEDGSDYWPFVEETAREVECWPECKRKASITNDYP